jgi:hypothetical protein
MKKISIIHKNEKVEFSIGTFKYIIDSSMILKRMVIQVFHHYMFKLSESEYSEDNNYQYRLLLDDREINIRNANLFIIHPYMDFESDLKLRSNSLLKMYFESKLQDIDLDEDFQTLSLLFNDFSETINDRINVDEDDLQLRVDMVDLDNKQLIKLLTPLLVMNDSKINFDELVYDEQLKIWIKLIEETASLNRQKQFIVLVDVQTITKSVQVRLEKQDLDNLSFIVFTNPPIKSDLENLLLSNTQITDLNNDQAIYENITLKKPSLNSLDSTKKLLLKYLNNHKTALFKDLPI